jgi:hypothetical protein
MAVPTAPKLLLLDSGAFSVWNRGRTIDLEQYIEFCKTEPASFYVNLDVIPGEPGKVHTRNNATIDRACQQGWDNYREMRRHLPVEQLVPVFHQDDDPKWIDRYLEDGVTYLGVSPGNDRTTPGKLTWMMRDVKPRLCGPDGNPVIRTHGFAVTSYRLMKAWHWFSVDSASWIRQAALGGVYVPGPRGSYGESPLVISFTPRSPARHERGAHYNTLSPTVKKQVDRYLRDVLNVGLGSWTVRETPVPAKVKLADGQRWYDMKKRIAMDVHEEGLMTDHQRRFWANAQWLLHANEVLPVDHIFFAGCGPQPGIEKRLGRRLLSYHDISTNKSMLQLFKRHQTMLRVSNENQTN